MIALAEPMTRASDNLPPGICGGIGLGRSPLRPEYRSLQAMAPGRTPNRTSTPNTPAKLSASKKIDG
eukprot:9438673-Pyramimonas_sp.AAC.1